MPWLRKKKEEKKVLEIPIAKIRPNPKQPRGVFEDTALESLAESIRRYGILQPISVREAEDGYEIIAGERRYRAAVKAALSTVPCLVYAVDGEQSAFLAVMENLLREDLNLFETALAMDTLCKEYGMTQDQIAERLSVSQSYVANKIRLLRLDDVTREKILTGNLTERHARALLRLPPTLWAKTADRMIASGCNVAAAEKLVEGILEKECKVGEQKRKRQMRGALKDIRLFYNSVDRAVDMVRKCGIAIQSRKEEEEGEIRLIISIPKTV